MTARCFEDLERLFRQHGSFVRRFLVRRLGSAEAADDVCQELFLRLWAKRPEVEVEQPRAYLMRIAANMATDHQRRLGRSRLSTHEALQETVSDTRPSPEAEAHHKQRLDALCRAVARLPRRCRQIFVMHKFEGLSHPEIARRLGISRNAVEKNIIRAMGYCRDEMRRQFGE